MMMLILRFGNQEALKTSFIHVEYMKIYHLRSILVIVVGSPQMLCLDLRACGCVSKAVIESKTCGCDLPHLRRTYY